jgi:tungstate transport system substrate-binding protein
MLRYLFLTLALAVPLSVSAQEQFITLASTTSAQQSGLLGHIIPLFRQQTGIDVRVLAVGSGRALQLGRQGEADALLVHDRAGEIKFMTEGHGLDRREVMDNSFVLVGPKTDPAGIRGHGAVEAAMRLAAKKAPFVSRGDDSGTEHMELRLWRLAEAKRPSGEGYFQTGQGMSETLTHAAHRNAYTLTDRATWLAFKDRKDLVILIGRDAALLNTYSSLLVSPAKGVHIKAADARTWHDWLTSEEGYKAIASFRIDGEQVFFSTSTKPRG